jgi:hypothetical protein
MLLMAPNYSISLRIYHPSIEPNDISEQLKISPDRSWMVGQQRSTPKGTLLEGVNDETYWIHTFDSEYELGPNDLLKEIFKVLYVNKPFFESIAIDGGRSELYLTIQSGENAGDIVSWKTLESFVHLEIDFSIEIFK